MKTTINISMAEEQRCEQSTSPRLCANNCGFFGSPATLDLCSKCYRDHCLNEKQQQDMEKLLTKTSPAAALFSSSSSLPIPAGSSPVEVHTGGFSASQAALSVPAEIAKPSSSSSTGPTRCGACRKRVGLTGFTCRCGMTFCGSHRYAEQHACTFDFKAAGKDAIAKANPIVKADKIDRI